MIKKIEILDFLKKFNSDQILVDFIENLILKNYENEDLVPKEKIEAISKGLEIKASLCQGKENYDDIVFEWKELIKNYSFN